MSDDFDDWYRRTSAGDPERPSADRQRAILEFARESAVRYAAHAEQVRAPIARSPRSARRRTLAGVLAAAMLAGFLVVPIWRSTSQRPIAPPAADTPRAPAALAESTSPDLPYGEATNKAQAPAYLDAVPRDAPTNALSGRQRAAVVSDVAAKLRLAAAGGDMRGLRALLEGSMDLNARDAAGQTALMLAVLNGQVDAAELLVTRGANVEAADLQGRTPLSVARVAGDRRMLEVLDRAAKKE